MPTLALPLVSTPSSPPPVTLPLPPPVGRVPGDTSPPIVCKAVFEELCVLANGDIVCWSADPDGERVYGNVHTDRIEDVYRGPLYREMRQWLLTSRPDSWCPTIRSHCPKRIVTAPPDYTPDGGRIRTLKLEPVTYCNIKCPACPVVSHFPHDPAVRDRRANKLLPLAVMIDVIDQLPHLELMLYYNMGEPFLHKDTVPFLRAARERLPHLVVATNTNGLVLTPAQINALGTEALINKIVFSIDGAEPASYARYRVGGDLPRALRKLTSLVETTRAAGNTGRVNIVWQYILFEWNDSDEELAKAKGLARQLGIPIEWVMTSGYGASKRFVAGSDAWHRLTDGGGSTTHMAAGTSLQNTRLIPARGTGDMDVFQKVAVFAEVSPARPTLRRWVRSARRLISPTLTAPAVYTAALSSPERVMVAPPGVSILFEVRAENRTGRPWASDVRDRFRPGVQIRTVGEPQFREVHVSLFEPTGETATSVFKLQLPSEPGVYELLFDVVYMEGNHWLYTRGSKPLVVPVFTDVSVRTQLACVLSDADTRGPVRRWASRLLRPGQPMPRYIAEFQPALAPTTAPPGARVLFEVVIENRSTRSARPADAPRLGVRLQTAAGDPVTAFPIQLSDAVCRPGSRTTVPLRVPLPDEAGRYQLLIDVFDPAGGRWLSELGRPLLVHPIVVE